MARFVEKRPSLPTEDESVDGRFLRRPVKGRGDAIRDFLSRPETVMGAALFQVLLLLVAPWTFAAVLIFAPLYFLWASTRKYRLPFRAPAGWDGIDYGAPKPGRPGRFGRAAGILHLGRDERSGEEIWIDNADARRHGFILGTTGSGKALPLDALVLTPQGWVRNGDLVPGMEIRHPDGGTSRILSVHPQGPLPVLRMHFSDGRMADCSPDHLWRVRVGPTSGTVSESETAPGSPQLAEKIFPNMVAKDCPAQAETAIRSATATGCSPHAEDVCPSQTATGCRPHAQRSRPFRDAPESTSNGEADSSSETAAGSPLRPDAAFMSGGAPGTPSGAGEAFSTCASGQAGSNAHERVMTARDIGLLHGLYGGRLEILAPLPAPHDGRAILGDELSEEHASRSCREGMDSLGYMPSVVGTPPERRAFLAAYLRAGAFETMLDESGLRVFGLPMQDAVCIKQIVWSLGGTAMSLIRSDERADVIFMFEGMRAFHPDAGACRFRRESGLGVAAVEQLDGDAEMSCIRTDREDGLYVMDNHIVTHNTELLLGVVSQTLMWSSGFLFIDGKGTTEFYARVWSLCKRFGREDDLRVLNFTDPGGDPDAPAGGHAAQSNTLNPFAKGSPDQLANIVISLLGEAGASNQVWVSRAMSLVTALMMALCELRDNGEILLNVQTIREFLHLGKGFDKAIIGERFIGGVGDVPEEAWRDLKTRAGLIELYLRAMRGEISGSARLALKGFFDTLPGFSLDRAMHGETQETKTCEQYGYVSMQFTKPLGSLADAYGHIFRTPLGEVDMDDVALNRRILVVLLPALQKAPDEMRNCGKIVVALVKIMMGNAAGFALQGTRRDIVEARQTRAPSPFVVVLDEAGYYMAKGIDVMMAQARSLGFMIVVAGQDMAAMQAVDPQIAETAAANASLLAVGKTVDGFKTIKFVSQMMGKTMVPVTSGYAARSGPLGGTGWVDKMDASFDVIDNVRLQELQGLSEGQFYILFNGRLVRAATFYIGDDLAESISVNRFLKVCGPADRAPGLDQTAEMDFLDGYVKVARKLVENSGLPAVAKAPDDSISLVKRLHDLALSGAGAPTADRTQAAWLVGIMGACGAGGEDDPEWDGDGDSECEWYMGADMEAAAESVANDG